jgi:hypothetical protein
MKPNTTPTPYGHGSSYTPATDGCPAPFVPAADRYSPAPRNAQEQQPQQPTTK